MVDLPSSCLTCTLCKRDEKTKKPIITTQLGGTDVIECTRKAGAFVAVNIAESQAVCLEDTQQVLPNQLHLQDITPLNANQPNTENL